MRIAWQTELIIAALLRVTSPSVQRLCTGERLVILVYSGVQGISTTRLLFDCVDRHTAKQVTGNSRLAAINGRNWLRIRKFFLAVSNSRQLYRFSSYFPHTLFPRDYRSQVVKWQLLRERIYNIVSKHRKLKVMYAFERCMHSSDWLVLASVNDWLTRVRS